MRRLLQRPLAGSCWEGSGWAASWGAHPRRRRPWRAPIARSGPRTASPARCSRSSMARRSTGRIRRSAASIGKCSRGTASCGTASPGTTSLGTASCGTASCGTASCGTASCGTASRGTASRSTEPDGATGDMMRVLVIEDNEDFRKLALMWFQSYGIEVEGAANGAQGLALQRARPADVIVTDIFMPEMEGIETIHDLRREFPEAKIIAMSGRDPVANLDVFEVARQVGAAKTFSKPFKFEDLIAAVRELSGAKEQRAP